MKSGSHPVVHEHAGRARVGAAIVCGLLLSMLAAACGPVGSGGTGAAEGFSQGPISGFGSIVVNNTHFDDTTALVQDEDGQPLSAEAGLHLGTTVALDATVPGSQGDTARATTIRVLADLVGPVTAALDPGTSQFTVMGQPVLVDGDSFFDGVAGPAALVPGLGVRVSALYEPVAGLYHATRISPAMAGDALVVRGAVGALAGETFQIGDQLFVSPPGIARPAGFAPGRLVRVKVAPQRDAQERWVATTIEDGVIVPPSGRTGALRGAVGVQVDATHVFVEGVPVDASTAAFHPSSYALGPGALVQVTGTMNGGTLVASRLDFRTVLQVRVGGGDQSDYGGDAFEIDGAIIGAVDPTTLVFTMRGPTPIDASQADFVGGTAADLAVGRVVHVYGVLSLDGTSVLADTVTFVD
jgi:hypothetical protein